MCGRTSRSAAGSVTAIVCWWTASLERTARPPGSAQVSTAPDEGEPTRGFAWGQVAHFLPSKQPRVDLEQTEHVWLRASWEAGGVSFGPISKASKRATQQEGSAAIEMARGLLLNREVAEQRARERGQRPTADAGGV